MYPRANGHCLTHHIPANVITLYHEGHPSRKEMDRALFYLRKKNTDLIKGDLVLFDCSEGGRNRGIVIFDGETIIDLSAEPDGYGTLPENFRVIEGGVPLTYWEYRGNDDHERGICHNTNVWFDHFLVLEECLKNVTYGLVADCKYAIYTTFNYNNSTYRIILDYTDHLYGKVHVQTFEFIDDLMKEELIGNFISILSNTEILIPFVLNSHYGDLTNTLYIPFYPDEEPMLSILGRVNPNNKFQSIIGI